MVLGEVGIFHVLLCHEGVANIKLSLIDLFGDSLTLGDKGILMGQHYS